MLGVEVGERAGVLPVVPDLSKNTGIDVAHENLPNCVKAVCDVQAEDLAVVFEGMSTQGLVVVVIKVEGLADEVQTVKVMHALNIDDETAAMLRTDLDVGISETAGNSVFIRDDTRSIVDTE